MTFNEARRHHWLHFEVYAAAYNSAFDKTAILSYIFLCHTRPLCSDRRLVEFVFDCSHFVIYLQVIQTDFT